MIIFWSVNNYVLQLQQTTIKQKANTFNHKRNDRHIFDTNVYQNRRSLFFVKFKKFKTYFCRFQIKIGVHLRGFQTISRAHNADYKLRFSSKNGYFHRKIKQIFCTTTILKKMYVKQYQVKLLLIQSIRMVKLLVIQLL